jgi:hypothetical protein
LDKVFRFIQQTLDGYYERYFNVRYSNNYQCFRVASVSLQSLI